MFFKIVIGIFVVLGACAFALIMSAVTDMLSDKIRKVMARQNKIRCLCRHEYEFICSWHYMGDMKEANYKCRKCGKELVITQVYKR